MNDNPPIGVSMGDPAGIGPEILAQAWAELRASGPVFFVIGDPAGLAGALAQAGLPDAIPLTSPTHASEAFAAGLPCLPASRLLDRAVTPGQPDPAHAPMITSAIADGVALFRAGEIRALVTAPIAKSVLYEAGFQFPGHTEYLAELTAGDSQDGPRGPAMMLQGGGLRVVLTSIHVSLREALETLCADQLIHTARLTHHALRTDFGIDAPRLALAGLNPHAGEGGALGREEIEILNPVAVRLRAEGIDISDARAPDTMFHAEARAGYDAAICLYHDQGLIPVKTLDFHGGVNITLGLPLVRTSPDHGTAFDLTGRGLARPDSLIAAIQTAAQIAEQRR